MAVKMYDGADQKFLDACKSAGINEPTRRQYKKFLQKRGKAYNATK